MQQIALPGLLKMQLVPYQCLKVKLTTRQILGYSEQVLSQRDPNWILKFGGHY